MAAGQVLVWATAALGVAAAIAAGWRRHLTAGAWLLTATATCAAGATGLLVRALVTEDWKFAYVVDHARRHTSGWYRVAGLWGGPEGSLLLFTCLLAVTAAVSAHLLARRRNLGVTDLDAAKPDSSRPAATTAVALLAATVAGFAVVVATRADPFTALAIPGIDGAGLTPILEHPAMLVHPPLLYLGLVTLVPAWAVTVAAAWHRSLDADWARLTRRWLLTPWTLLVAGTALGANWAYVELGWGGYWAWDAVENTALVPWLLATASLHLSARARGTGSLRSAAAVGAAAWLCVVFGTLITRAGASPSVHAFAEDGALGRALAVVALASSVATVTALARRTERSGEQHPQGRLSQGRLSQGRLSQGLLGAAVLMSSLAAIVAIGTVAPVGEDWLRDQTAAVEGTYYAAFAGPLAVVALALLGLVPALSSADRGASRRRDAVAVAAATVGGVGLGLAVGWRDLFPVAVAGLGAGALAGTLIAARRRSLRGWAALAHTGIIVLLVGVAGSTTAVEATVVLAPGEMTELGGYSFEAGTAEVVAASRSGEHDRVQVDVVVRRNGSVVGTLRPALVSHTDRRRVLLAETALRSTPLDDVGVVLRDVAEQGPSGATVVQLDLGVRPLVSLVWVGAAMLTAAGAWALTHRSAKDPRSGAAAPTRLQPVRSESARPRPEGRADSTQSR